MKIAKVIPIYKTGDRHTFSNYKLISLLSQFSKILVKLVYTRLNDFLIKYDILSKQKYGFRSIRTVTHVLKDFVEKISNATEINNTQLGYF